MSHDIFFITVQCLDDINKLFFSKVDISDVIKLSVYFHQTWKQYCYVHFKFKYHILFELFTFLINNL